MIRTLRFTSWFFICFLVSFSLNAAENTFARKIAGGSPNAIIETKDLGLVLLSTISSSEGKFQIRKIDASGTHEWQKRFSAKLPTDEEIFPSSLIQLPDGNYILAGGVTRFAYGFPFGGRGWLAKLSSAGNIDWQRSFNVTGYDLRFRSVVAFQDGIIVAGAQTEELLGPSSDAGLTIARFANDGSILWGKIFTHSSLILSDPRLLKTSDGGQIAACRAQDKQNGRAIGAVIFKIDEGGNILWSKFLERSNFSLESVALTSNDGAILTFSIQNKKVFVVRLDSTGSIIWKKAFRAGSYTVPFSATQGSDGSFILTGMFLSTTHTYDGYIVRLSPAGAILSVKKFDTGSDDYPFFILSTSGGGFVVTGEGAGGFLLKLDSDASLPGCTLLNSAKATKQKFGALKTSDPEIRSTNWNVQSSNNFKLTQKKTRVRDSNLCP